jgi:hypothetical protein
VLTQGEKLLASVVLEGMIDKHGLYDVLDMLAEVCTEKAEHIRTNWQDKKLASVWDQAGRALTVAQAAQSIKLVSYGRGGN